MKTTRQRRGIKATERGERLRTFASRLFGRHVVLEPTPLERVEVASASELRAIAENYYTERALALVSDLHHVDVGGEMLPKLLKWLRNVKLMLERGVGEKSCGAEIESAREEIKGALQGRALAGCEGGCEQVLAWPVEGRPRVCANCKSKRCPNHLKNYAVPATGSYVWNEQVGRWVKLSEMIPLMDEHEFIYACETFYLTRNTELACEDHEKRRELRMFRNMLIEEVELRGEDGLRRAKRELGYAVSLFDDWDDPWNDFAVGRLEFMVTKLEEDAAYLGRVPPGDVKDLCDYLAHVYQGAPPPMARSKRC